MRLLLLFAALFPTITFAADAPRPNILWITSEDNGPHLGCYGDQFATTPQLDALAQRGMIYRRCWSNAPVCAPARTTIISGVYPQSLGAQHMRSMIRMPKSMKMYPQFLREAGYYCTNNSKEDYNLEKPGQVWDESSGKAHWKNRKPGQPFFAIFNHTVSHESQIRNPQYTPEHNPAEVRVPDYHPDAPEVRRDWAHYYDQLSKMDARAGENLKELSDAGLTDDTIIFYYGDHGSGMPRNKRWPYHSGLHVPLIVFVPEKFKELRPDDYRAGGESGRLVAFVDLAPTVLSLAGIEPPAWMQGDAFLGKYIAPPRQFNHGFRGRMDERYDMVRSVTDGRYVYIRNYMPHKIYGQYIAYMFQTPTTRIWKQLFDEGRLNDAQSHFWKTKPAEELYDLQSDPDEVVNLAGSTEHKPIRDRLRRAQQAHAREIRDVGFLPEGEIHTRSTNSSPYEMGQDAETYPLEIILPVAELAAAPESQDAAQLVAFLTHADSAVRYWAATGLLIREHAGVEASREQLQNALTDSSPYVRIAAAEALGRYGNEADLKAALPVLLELANLETHGVYSAMPALNALDFLDDRAAGVVDGIRALPTSAAGVNGRMRGYVPNLVKKTLADFEVTPPSR